jgi:hypothetical protein
MSGVTLPNQSLWPQRTSFLGSKASSCSLPAQPLLQNPNPKDVLCRGRVKQEGSHAALAGHSFGRSWRQNERVQILADFSEDLF